VITDTFSNMVTRAGRKIQRTDTAYKTKLKDWANERYERLYNRYFWNELFREKLHTLISGQDYLILPVGVTNPLYLSDRSNAVLIRKVGVQNFQKRYLANLASQGVVLNWASWGYSPVALQLSTADTIEVLSSSTSDTTQKVYLRGYDTNGQELDESITLTGTSAAASTNTYTAFSITDPTTGLSMVSKDGDTVGSVTVREATSDTVLGRLGPKERALRHRIIRLHNVPSAADTIYIGYKEPIRKLINDGDVTQFPCESILVHGMFVDALKEQRQFQRAAAERNTVEAMIGELLLSQERDEESDDSIMLEMGLQKQDIDRERTF
jgi:hypothetical protein